jgi:2-polyprenyl-3-methyl-5-hydroxy-6-metoxy-1,4-benzoquinol methylase
VIALAVIEHVKDPGAFLRELVSRLSSAHDNFIICTTPNPTAAWVHTAGAKIGLFSRHASKEHENSLDKVRLVQAASETDLKLIAYKRFLFGVNQLAVFQRRAGKNL